MIHLLLFIFFLTTPFIIKAEHMDAYKWNGGRLTTSNGDHIYNMRKGNSIMWYYSSNNKEPACKFNTINLNLDYLDVKDLTGDKFNSKICIKPNSYLWYFEILNQGKNEESLCLWSSYRLTSNENIRVDASCNKYGCLTSYGWVKNEDIC